jgi:putative phosphoesterase
MRTVVGVISDTHGLVRSEAARALSGVDLIIHGGDVGKPDVLAALGQIAAVRAVRGNVDIGVWAELLPTSLSVEVQGVRIFALHKRADLDFDPAAEGFGVVIFGHSHKAIREIRDGVLYLNPGSAGPRRFRLPVTVARLTVSGGAVQAEIIPLKVP